MADQYLYPPKEPDKWSTANYPLGAHYKGKDVTFAVYSRHATRVLLELYSKALGEEAVQEVRMVKNKTDHIWRARLAAIPPGTFYAFRCWGPNWEYIPEWKRGNSAAGFLCDVDTAGNRFNPNKILFDPYTREISHDKISPGLTAAGEDGWIYYTGDGLYHNVKRREWDTGRWAPKGVIIMDNSQTGKRPMLAPEKAAIYEAHVRGLTRHSSTVNLKKILTGIPGFEAVPDIPEAWRGTYKAAGMMAKYIKALGFTTIEFLPVQETDNEANPENEAGGNYWGYMTFGYFAPDRRYAYNQAPGGPTAEFKEMVKAFHDEGLEVYLDVVFNHTGEEGNRGDRNTVSFVSYGGFDTPDYYILKEDKSLEDGATGCGNQVNFSTDVTCTLVLDALAYWIKTMGVDGFRFDLAPVMGRIPRDKLGSHPDEQKHFFHDHPLLLKIRDLGAKHKVEMIAEAWDLWGYEVGNFPSGWGEWNGRYRDTVRKFLKGDANTDSFVEMVNGDFSHYPNKEFTHRSINFIVAHDGFTLADLVSYNHKNNRQNWPFGPSDGGADDNNAWDSGGDHVLRRQRLRNLWVILFLSRGIPMIVYGDEFGRTQNGNNNPYNIDSAATWNNYRMIAANSPHLVPTGSAGEYHNNLGTALCAPDVNPLFRFAVFTSHLRKNHPALKQRSWGGRTPDLQRDAAYLFKKADGYGYLGSHDRCVWLRIDSMRLKDHALLVFINMYSEQVSFAVPASGQNGKWVRIIDTAAWAEPDFNYWEPEKAAVIKRDYIVHPFSVVVLEAVNA